MTIWEFIDNHWFLAMMALCIAYGITVRLIRLPLLLLHGWPTPPIDADGDIKHPDKPEAA